MKIEKLEINKLYPLTPMAESLADYTIIFGENESGKSLILEVIERLLFPQKKRKTAKSKGKEKEDDYRGEGAFVASMKIQAKGVSLVLSSDDGKDKLELPFSQDECRNLFIFRDSDIRIDKESEFLSALSDKILGSKTIQIESIIQNIKILGNITKTNLDKTSEIQTLLDKAAQNVQEINTLQTQVQSAHLEDLETEYAKKQSERETNKKELERQEMAEKRIRYTKARTALDEYQRLEALENACTQFTEANLREWQRSEDSHADLNTQKAKHIADQAEITKKIDALKASLEESQSTLMSNEPILKQIEVAQPLVSNYRNKLSQQVVLAKAQRPLIGLAIAALLVVFGFGLSPPLLPAYSWVIIIGIVLVMVISPLVYLSFALQYKMNLLWQELTQKFVGFKIIFSTVDELDAKMQEYRTQNEVLRSKEQETQKKLDLEQQLLLNDQKQLAVVISKQDQNESAIIQIKVTTGFTTLDELRKKVEETKQNQSQRAAQTAVLKTLLKNKESTTEWKSELAILEPFKDKALDCEHDPNKVTGLKRELENNEKTIDQLRTNLAELRGKFVALEKSMSEIFGVDQYFCKSIADLEMLKQINNQFIDQKENAYTIAKRSVELFGEILKEEETQKKKLFATSMISTWFEKISGGNYTMVEYNETDKRINVQYKTQKDPVYKLSKGTLDQLYFVVRLAMLVRFFKDEPGFLLLDDPFLKADMNRILRQLALLKELNQQGWQIILFTMRADIRDLLVKDPQLGVKVIQPHCDLSCD